MEQSMAELECRYGRIDESRVQVILAPDVLMTLYPDGSSTVEYRNSYVVHESCWAVEYQSSTERSFIDFYE